MSLSSLRDQLNQIAREETTPDADLARQFLESPELSTTELLTAAGIPREKHFGREVRIHILNNVRNGHCGEDCGYCAQRKTAPEDVPAYADKTETEILAEAQAAYDSGAFRYCMVTSGRGPGPRSVERYADLIRKIKSLYPLEVCLSAGIVTDAALAQELASAGLDRYNHNLNTSREHYEHICTTHDYDDRMATLETMQSAGVALCSGVIAGMGERPHDLVVAALALRERNVPSIPINFFIPVQGHAIEEPTRLNADYCLRVLALFRLTNPRAEIRM
ncbi:MAG: biotin synthase BioB, partial [Leptospiraceae bacterium]|nr:biotin synthase BioB [Leptospiraceae bacterium]